MFGVMEGVKKEYSLYFCSNVDNFAWLLTTISLSPFTKVDLPKQLLEIGNCESRILTKILLGGKIY